jgi:hypothetical protein
MMLLMSEQNHRAAARAQASLLVFGDPDAHHSVSFDASNDGVLVPWAALVETLQGALSGTERRPLVPHDVSDPAVTQSSSSETSLAGLRDVLARLRHLVREVG